MTYLGKISEVNANVLTEVDTQYMQETKIFRTETDVLVLKFNCDDAEYAEKWRRRVGATFITDVKEKQRILIELEVGDIRDRLADSFKFNTILMFMVSELYKLCDVTQIDANMKILFDKFINTVETATSEMFNIDLKSSYTDTLAELLSREQKVVDIIKNSAV